MNILKWMFDWNYVEPKEERIKREKEHKRRMEERHLEDSMEYTGSLFRCDKCGRNIYSDANTNWKWKHFKHGIKHKAVYTPDWS